MQLPAPAASIFHPVLKSQSLLLGIQVLLLTTKVEKTRLLASYTMKCTLGWLKTWSTKTMNVKKLTNSLAARLPFGASWSGVRPLRHFLVTSASFSSNIRLWRKIRHTKYNFQSSNSLVSYTSVGASLRKTKVTDIVTMGAFKTRYFKHLWKHSFSWHWECVSLPSWLLWVRYPVIFTS